MEFKIIKDTQLGKHVVPVTFDYNFDQIIGSATIGDDGQVHIQLTDPRIIDLVHKDSLKHITLVREPAKEFT